jgi:predicted adenine nucleotide alpha hydrolase (AANH) superfamily ATPase
MAKEHGLEWVHSDFKKDDGFRKSTEMSREMGLYRQKYCGCFYSVKSGECKGE